MIDLIDIIIQAVAPLIFMVVQNKNERRI